MARPAYKDRLLASVGTSGQAAETHKPDGTRSMVSARKLDAAHHHLDKMWADAEGEQIDGRRFYGKITLEVPFQNGEPQRILASKAADDKVIGGRTD